MGSGKARARTRTIAFLAAAGGLATLAAAAWALASQARIEVRVVPDRPVWRPGETITGKVVVASYWPRPVELVVSGTRWLHLKRPDGKEPERSSGWTDPRPMVSATGEEAGFRPVMTPFSMFEFDFEIGTEPLAASGGYVLDDGPYLLEVETPALEVPCRARRALIEVRSPPGERLMGRIVEAVAASGRLSFLRWDGSVEVHDLESGARIFSSRVHRPRGLSLWQGRATLSPDGSELAVLREAAEDPNGESAIELHALDPGSGAPRRIPIRFEGKVVDGGLYILFYSGSRMRIASSKFYVLDVDTSAARISRPNLCNVRIPLPDGNLFSDWMVTKRPEEPSAGPERFRGRVHHPVLYPMTLGDLWKLRGSRGGYTGNRELNAVIFHGDGSDLSSPARIHTSASIPVGESPCGRFLLLSSATLEEWRSNAVAGRLEVWDVERRRRLSAIEDGKHRAGWLAGAPLKLICGIHRRGEGGAAWLDDTFEVRDPETGGLLRTMDVSGGR